MTKVIAFDLDDTLWDSEPTLKHAETALFEWCCAKHPEFSQRHSILSLAQMRVAMKQPGPMSTQITRTRERVLTQAFLDCGETDSAASRLAQKGMDLFLAKRQQVHLFKNTLALLQTIEKDFCLISATNGNANVFRTPIGQFFKHHFSAEAIGFAKPDARFFKHIESELSMSRDAFVLIGDSDKYDQEGARAADWNFIKLAPKNSGGELNVEQLLAQIGRLP
ncbi:MAG: HAD family hydrolase [Gammaproteobacteria bacterium]|nr:HAD family hydrolase [Gammaproteobacteria bacterium]